jgi:hypothetical protein
VLGPTPPLVSSQHLARHPSISFHSYRGLVESTSPSCGGTGHQCPTGSPLGAVHSTSPVTTGIAAVDRGALSQTRHCTPRRGELGSEESDMGNHPPGHGLLPQDSVPRNLTLVSYFTSTDSRWTVIRPCLGSWEAVASDGKMSVYSADHAFRNPPCFTSPNNHIRFDSSRRRSKSGWLVCLPLPTRYDPHGV